MGDAVGGLDDDPPRWADLAGATLLRRGDAFPDVMLDAPARLRFSVASEYGELSVIGSEFAQRDDAPDDDQQRRRGPSSSVQRR